MVLIIILKGTFQVNNGLFSSTYLCRDPEDQMASQGIKVSMVPRY